MNKKGKLICVVGADGVGKTSVINQINKKLQDNNINTKVTREPGGVPVSEKIREIILENDIDSLTECYLFASARRENVINNLIPALNEGKIVLMDRYYHCSLVYQGIVEGVGLDRVLAINEPIIKDCKPDLTIILDLDSKKAIERMKIGQDRTTNRFDEKDEDYHNKVRRGYLHLQNIIKNTFVVNADQDLDKVVNDCLKIINDNFNLIH